MTTTWFEGNGKTREQHEQYRPSFYAAHCDECEALLSHERSRNIKDHIAELKENLVFTVCYVEKIESYKDFKHFCNSQCQEAYELRNDVKPVERKKFERKNKKHGAKN